MKWCEPASARKLSTSGVPNSARQCFAMALVSKKRSAILAPVPSTVVAFVVDHLR